MNSKIEDLNSSSDKDSEWKRYRTDALARAQRAGIEISIPLRRPRKSEGPRILPLVAPDGRRDLSTIDYVRKGKDY